MSTHLVAPSPAARAQVRFVVGGGADGAAALENWQEQRPRSRSRSC